MKEDEVDEEYWEPYVGKGLGSVCFLCGQVITKRDCARKLSKNGVLGNVPVRANNIPGYVHRKCRGDLSGNLIDNPVGVEDLTNEIKKL